MEIDLFHLIGGALIYLMFGFTPLPAITFAAVLMIFNDDQKWSEKFLIILGGIPFWGFYLILVLSALNELLIKENPIAFFLWIGCLHCIYIWGWFETNKTN